LNQNLTKILASETLPNNDLLLRILEAAPEAILAVDGDWVVTFANQKAVDLIGLADRKVIGENLLELYPEHSGPDVWRQFHEARDEGVSVTLEQYFDTIGDLFEVRAIPDGDDLLVFFQNFYPTNGTDVSEQARSLALKLNHDLRTGLNSIIGFADLLKTTEAEDSAAYVSYIVDAGNQLLTAFEGNLRSFVHGLSPKRLPVSRTR
jgi:PAS domain S-box-containing protein